MKQILSLGSSRIASWAAPALLATLAALFITPVVIGDAFVYHVFVTICIFAALSTAWNIVGGFAGQLSLGHAIFYGIGAYAGVILMNLGISPWLGMFVGAAFAALAAVVISYPCFRLHGPFFALATIAFLEVFRVLALHFRDLTGGATGLMIPIKMGWQWMVFRERLPSLIIAFGMLLFCLAVAQWIRSGKLGYYLVATRERESAAKAAGVRTVQVRLIAVAISAALASMVGTFHAMYLTFIEPSAMFSLSFSIQIAMFALIGGIGTVYGPLLGALLLVPLTELARGWLGAEALGLHGFVYGVLLVLAVLFMPNGIMGVLHRYLQKSEEEEEPRQTQAAPVAAVPRAEAEHEAGPEILRAENLDKHFGGLHVTKDVSFSLREGEILGMIGPNGAGKTTLFNMLSGFLQPDSGKVTVSDSAGNFSAPISPADFASIGVGRTFQIVQPFAAMTVEENIMVGAFHRHPDVNDAREAARETAHRMGLGPWLNAEANGLTIGGLKRLEVARVMAMQPRILLLDEVMAGINQTDVRRAIDLMLSIRDTGVSIIAIEHVMQAVMSLSDRVIVLNSGEIVAEGDPQEVVRDPHVIEAYLGKGFADANS
ncbi:lipopolysaccharide export system ATP-binding protein LptB [Roseovarius sp. A-2]|uniref:branched-chain amino acid ABC transporter ATP-binding protein/permease n=1 Tax=Roseovarius sp. A-2 TaxID=1570360 RepID=UPI0009B53FA6|nr:branched-chain amino acid ABC transporter ATP-binding protein/permease [Roseovarius sp. A-2]GAW33530.1 lipopolysaccharide export system ATP-binding protein LptB [Roseovarius sp. A-2]